MRLAPRSWLLVAALATPAAAQIATPRPSGLLPSPKAPATVEGYVVTLDIRALAPEMKTPKKAVPEAQALVQDVKGMSQLVSRFWLSRDFSNQEVLSTDFLLPQGTRILHKAGDRFYVIADPKQRTYVVMDSWELLGALEGGAGILNSGYDAKVAHTQEWKDVAGLRCRKSILTVAYASSIPFENERVMVQQKNDIEVWHSGDVVSAVAMDHLFFKFQQDKVGAVRRVVEQDLGFPAEVRFVVTQAGAKTAAPQAGSFHSVVTEFRKEKKLEGSMFQIPPEGYRKLERNPYFAAAVR
jgi:hypothetical protein